jgi:glycosyltransferase involved in cell wall biosynthesis
VIHEAFACGVPVLVSRTGGMCELVEDKKGGLFFNTGDKEDLKANLRKLIEEPHLIISLKNTIPDVKDIKNHVEIILSVYESICSQI